MMEFPIPYKNERIEGAIAFFASEHKKKTRENLSQTALYKYLAFFDFRSLEESGEPALGLTYQAMKNGPVPKEIYIDKQYRKSKYYQFFEKPFYKEGKEFTAVEIIPKDVKSKDYLEFFSEYDLKLMNDLVFIFSQLWVTAKVMSDASHEKRNGIKAWVKTWKRQHNATIDMAETFDNLHEKYNKHTTTIAEEHFYIYQKLHAN